MVDSHRTHAYLRESANSYYLSNRSAKNLSVVATIPKCLTKRCEDCSGYYANRIAKVGLKCNCECHHNIENSSENSFYFAQKQSETFESYRDLIKEIRIDNPKDTRTAFRMASESVSFGSNKKEGVN